jgi:hypothetical protein
MAIGSTGLVDTRFFPFHASHWLGAFNSSLTVFAHQASLRTSADHDESRLENISSVPSPVFFVVGLISCVKRFVDSSVGPLGFEPRTNGL